VGGKCANLGELAGKIGVPVPNGFAVSANAYKVFLEKTKADKMIESLLAGIDMADMQLLQNVSKKIRKHVERLPMPKEMNEIRKHEKLGAHQEKDAGCRPLLRDCRGFAWRKLRRTAGHFLNITGNADSKHKEVLGSLFRPAQSYTGKKRIAGGEAHQCGCPGADIFPLLRRSVYRRTRQRRTRPDSDQRLMGSWRSGCERSGNAG
jgi:hypothetical protein